VHIEPDQACAVAKATSIERLKDFSRQINDLEQSRLIRADGYVYDRQTLLHQNHIVDGGIGYGAGLLNSEQMAQIDRLLREEGFESLCATDDARRVASNPSSSATDPEAFASPNRN